MWSRDRFRRNHPMSSQAPSMKCNTIILLILVYVCAVSVFYYSTTSNVPRGQDLTAVSTERRAYRRGFLPQGFDYAPVAHAPLHTMDKLNANPAYHMFKFSVEKQQLCSRMSRHVTLHISDVRLAFEKACKKFGFPLQKTENAPPRVFYGILFANEIDMLEIFLYEMYDYLHCLVIVESDVTFTGLPRQMNFLRYAERLKRYASKIVYVPYVSNPTDTFSHTEGVAYGREVAIRNSIRSAWLRMGIRSDDLAVVGDADEILSSEFMAALSSCDVFPEHSEVYARGSRNRNDDDSYPMERLKGSYPDDEAEALNSEALVKSRGTRQFESIQERCNNRTKVMARIDVFSSYLDCPLIAQYYTAPNIDPGIKIYWHPDIVPAECVIHADITNVTVENLRTMGGSLRLQKVSTGWHFRNQAMTPEEIYFKYHTYGHPEQTPLGRYFNVSAAEMLVDHVRNETARDCEPRERLLRETGYGLANMPRLLRDRVARHRFKELFYNFDEFYRWMGDPN